MNKKLKVDAAILAGTHLEKDKLVYGQNKAFLDFHGKPVVQWVLDALHKANYIDRIVLIGPSEKVNAIKENTSIPFIAVEQKGQLLDNAWVSFLALCPQAEKYPTDVLEYLYAEEAGTFEHPEDVDREHAILIITGDVPLTLPEGIDDFIERCDLASYDMFFGLSNEETLKPFYPTLDRRGIIRPYVHFKDEKARVGNIQIVKPLKFGRLFLIQRGYAIRKLKLLRNVFKLFKIILGYPYGIRAIGYVTLLQISGMLHKYGLPQWAKPIRNGCKKGRLEFYLTNFLKTSFKLINSPFGGMSIDIDNVEDFEILREFFPKWIENERKIIASIDYDNEAH